MFAYSQARSIYSTLFSTSQPSHSRECALEAWCLHAISPQVPSNRPSGDLVSRIFCKIPGFSAHAVRTHLYTFPIFSWVWTWLMWAPWWPRAPVWRAPANFSSTRRIHFSKETIWVRYLCWIDGRSERSHWGFLSAQVSQLIVICCWMSPQHSGN